MAKVKMSKLLTQKKMLGYFKNCCLINIILLTTVEASDSWSIYDSLIFEVEVLIEGFFQI